MILIIFVSFHLFELLHVHTQRAKHSLLVDRQRIAKDQMPQICSKGTHATYPDNGMVVRSRRVSENKCTCWTWFTYFHSEIPRPGSPTFLADGFSRTELSLNRFGQGRQSIRTESHSRRFNVGLTYGAFGRSNKHSRGAKYCFCWMLLNVVHNFLLYQASMAFLIGGLRMLTEHAYRQLCAHIWCTMYRSVPAYRPW